MVEIVQTAPVVNKTWLNCDHEFTNKDNNHDHLLHCVHNCGAIYNLDYKTIFRISGDKNGNTTILKK
jgi:hypothetical protein